MEKVRFSEISGELFRDVLVVLLQTREAVDGRGARIDGLPAAEPLQKKRHGLIVSQRTERAKSGVAKEAVRRIGGDGGVEVVAKALGVLRRPRAATRQRERDRNRPVERWNLASRNAASS